MNVWKIAAWALALGGCAAPPAPATSPAPATTAAPRTPGAVRAPERGDTSDIPPGYGTLKQDDIAIKLQTTDVLVRLIPLDEYVIRTLAPDSYRTLHQILESKRDQISRLASMHALRERNVWYVSFFGLAQEARFVPTDITVTSGGRDLRPLEILPLTNGFGEQRLGPRETQSALYLFDDGINVAQSLTVRMGTDRNDDWQETGILRTIERERAIIRSRAARGRVP